MNNFEAYLVELLQGHITHNNNPVEVRKHFSNDPTLPCITLDLSGGVSTDYYYYDYIDDKEVLYHHCTSNINISVWCNTEEEREDICQQIQECFIDEKTFHYKYCTQYIEGRCRNGGNCHIPNPYSDRRVKDKCPDPDRYEYESLRSKHYVLDNTVRLEPPFDMDEFDRHPPLLRSILRCSGEYEVPVKRHGIRIEELLMGELDVE